MKLGSTVYIKGYPEWSGRITIPPISFSEWVEVEFPPDPGPDKDGNIMMYTGKSWVHKDKLEIIEE
jgi:hypothetical protein